MTTTRDGVGTTGDEVRALGTGATLLACGIDDVVDQAGLGGSLRAQRGRRDGPAAPRAARDRARRLQRHRCRRRATLRP